MGDRISRDYAYYRQAILDSDPDMIGYIINRAASEKSLTFRQFCELAKLAEWENSRRDQKDEKDKSAQAYLDKGHL